MTDRPATEPRTERLRRLAATPMSKWRAADVEWMPRPAGIYGADAEVDDREFAAWLADWAEAAQGAAPRAEGLEREAAAATPSLDVDKIIEEMPVAVLATDGGPAVAYAMRVEAYLRARLGLVKPTTESRDES